MHVNVKLLREQHKAIFAAIDALRALVDQPFEQGFAGIANARLRLAKVVADNMASETAEIHEPLQTHRLTSKIPAYAGIADGTRELRLAFSAHIARWSMAVIKQDWDGYGRSLRRLLAQLADILHREEQNLFPAAQILLASVDR